MSYFDILLLIHILSAIVGFGPTFSFAVLGPLAKNTGGPAALGIMEGMEAVVSRMVLPALLVVQPVSGILLIFEGGWNVGFFEQEWLVAGIVIYALLVFLAAFVQVPNSRKMIALAKGGQAGSPEFAALAKRTATVGPVMTLVLLAIIFLMVIKPGA